MSNRLSIVFYVNGMPFQGDTLEKASLGGSETAGLYMAREMARRGHDVIVFSNTDKPAKYDGVNYLHIDGFMNYAMFTPIDVLIVQRVPQIFGFRMKSKINILWQHDIGQKRNAPMFRGSMWNVDEVWGVSKFHVDQMAETYGVPKSAFWATRNGLDTITTDDNLPRHAKRLIYTSRPERGLDILLLEIMPRLWAVDPDIELQIAGYDNTVAEMKPFYDMLRAKCADYVEQGRKVEWLGALTKERLYTAYQQATLYAYPTAFEEVSCITAMECMANGLPFVASRLAALPETLTEGAGVLIDGDARGEQYQAQFAQTVLNLLNHPELCIQAGAVGKAYAEELSWSELAADWEKHLYEMFAARTSNVNTLATHLYRYEDIMALKALNVPEWNERVKTEYPLFGNPSAYSQLYTDYGKNFRAKIESGELSVGINEYARVKVAINCMSKPHNLLDYGCAIGNEAIQFVNAFDCKVTAVNISEDEMAVGQLLAVKHCTKPENITWVRAAEPSAIDGLFDTVFAGEILEHVEKPQEFINQLEAKCADGGQMFFTVPLGPWGDVNEICEQRGHLWNFEKLDLKDLFEKKKDFRAQVVSGMVNEKNKETLGWYVISYIKTGLPENATGEIDMIRKLSIQAPRQSVSACLIIGGAQEGHLHKCLESIMGVADQIIVCDTGMSEKSKAVLAHYPRVELMQAPNPLTAGFDTARNASIAGATGDWILWIDSDEELLGAVNIFKFLRANHYDGYSIRQHHFSASPINAFPPDMPIRLFRNRRGAQFFGFVHEHPEKAMNSGIGESTILSDVEISHTGYLTEDIRRKRFMRNYPLMKKDRDIYPDRVLGKFLMMRDNVLLARYKYEQNKSLTPEIVMLCEDVVKTYCLEFLGKPSMMSTDGLMFYSEALSLLGRGTEFVFGYGTNNGKEPDMTVARFANSADFLKYMTSRVQETARLIEGKYA